MAGGLLVLFHGLGLSIAPLPGNFLPTPLYAGAGGVEEFICLKIGVGSFNKEAVFHRF